MSTYVKPGDVHAPKRHWQLFHVVFDGGDKGHPRAQKNSAVSLAIGRWDGRPVLAIRWNGTKDNPLGNPQSRGLPTWFIIPDQYVQAILAVMGFSDSKLRFVYDFLELRRVYFLTRCPTPGCSNFGGLVLASYRSEELQQAMAELDQGDPRSQFYCIFCDEAWYPTPDEKERLKHEMQKGWAAYCEAMTPEAPAAMDERDARCREAARAFLAGTIDSDTLLDHVREARNRYTAALKRDLGQG